jgi:hypothetical protein
MRLTVTSRCSLAFCLAGWLPAQFIVDAANGPGTHFTSLMVAINTVPDGATLLVRAGDYVITAPTTVSRGLSIVGLGGVRVTEYAQLTFGPTQSSQAIRLVNLTLASGSPVALLFTDVAGPLLLDRITCPPSPVCVGLEFTRCQNVHIQQLQMGAPSLTGFVAAADSRLRMQLTRASLRTTAVSGHFLAGVGMTAIESALWLEDCNLAGGDGLSCFRGQTTNGGTGLVMTNTEAVLRACTVRGGDGGSACPSGLPGLDAVAINGTSGSLHLELTTLVSRRGGISGNVTVRQRNTVIPPRTSTTSNSIDLNANAGSTAALVLGTLPVLEPIRGAIGVLELTPLVLVGPVTIGASGWSVPVTLPPSALRATVLAQHAVWDGADLWLTAAAQIVLP